MATKYRTKDGDVLDRICWKYYGNETSLNAVCDANPGIEEYGVVLPAGIVITLPEIKTAVVSSIKTLWN